MKVKSIKLENFMSHDSFSVDLPETGIVVITGANGKGKSSLIEAIPAALWDKTLRGSKWFRPDGESKVTIELDQGTYTRKRVGNSSKVTLEHRSDQFDTATKAKETIESEVGNFDTWRRTCVFSSQDSHHFSLATDSERKRLLEVLLGLDAFEEAYKEAKSDLKLVNSKAIGASNVKAVTEAKIEAKRDAISRIKPSKKPVIKGESKEIELLQLRGKLEAMVKEKESLTKPYTEAAIEARRARKGFETAKSSGVCPTCGHKLKDLDPEHLNKLEQEAIALEDKAVELQEKISCVQKEISALNKTIQPIQYAHKVWEDSSKERAMWAKHNQALKEEVKKFGKELKALEKELEYQNDTFISFVHKANILEQSIKVLGTKGVRSLMLGSAIAALEESSNSWLSEIFPGVSLKLSTLQDSKNGSFDKVSLNISGLPHNFGYKASSGGQRRRLDIALLLALSDLVRGDSDTNSTLFFDEVTDALDVDGIESVSSVLNRISLNRCVVLITHNPEVVDAVRPSLHIKL